MPLQPADVGAAGSEQHAASGTRKNQEGDAKRKKQSHKFASRNVEKRMKQMDRVIVSAPNPVQAPRRMF